MCWRAAGQDNEVLATAAGAAQALHVSIIGAGTVVAVVRSTVRDMIAQAVGELISIALRWAAATVATLGAAVPGAIAEVAIRVAAWSAKIAGWLQKLVQAIRRLAELIEQVSALLGRALATIRNAAAVKLLTGSTKFKYQQNVTAPPVPGTHRAPYPWSVDANHTGDAIKTARSAASAASTADDRYRKSQGEE